ncbi:uncharacterized protein LOC144988552 [Oryzias latipes]
MIEALANPTITGLFGRGETNKQFLIAYQKLGGLLQSDSLTLWSATWELHRGLFFPLSSFLFTLYTADCYNSDTCHIQKFADDTAIVGCISGDEEEEYRSLVDDFVVWSHKNNLQLNTSKTKELVVDFGRDRPNPRPVLIGVEEVEVVQTYTYLGLWLDIKLDWTSNTGQLYKKAQSRMYFLRRLRSFNICKKLLGIFYQSVVASVLTYAVVCWGGSTSKTDFSRLEKLIRRAGSVVGTRLDPLATVAERRTL